MVLIKKQTEKIKISPIRPATANELLIYEESLNGDYKRAISDLKDTVADHAQRITNLEQKTGIKSICKIAYVTLLADNWQGIKNPWHQVVSIEGVTPNSQVDLMPSAEQIEILQNKNLGFVAENADGTVTIYAIGQKPVDDFVFQVTITEVSV